MKIWWHQPKNVSTAPGKLGKICATMFTMLTLPRSERLRLAWAGLNTQQLKLLVLVWRHVGVGGRWVGKGSSKLYYRRNSHQMSRRDDWDILYRGLCCPQKPPAHSIMVELKPCKILALPLLPCDKSETVNDADICFVQWHA